MPKLCSLLVEDEEVAAKLIELNRRKKGRNVNILPLSFVKNSTDPKVNVPANIDSLANQDWVQVKTNGSKLKANTVKTIEGLVHSTFSKYVLVEKYETALSVSK